MIGLLKTIIAWGLMAFIGTNLIGFIVRGFVQPLRQPESGDEKASDVIANEVQRLRIANAGITILAFVLTIAYLWALYHFWNIGLAASASILMLSRVPDLLWEIRTGSKVRPGNAPKSGIYIIATVLMWIVLPLIWYSLCKW